jgi:hypothetical protein
MPDPHCCHCELFRVPRVTSPPTGIHKCYSRATEGRHGMVVVWQGNARQHCVYSAPDVTSAGASVYSDYCSLIICSFSFSLPFGPTFLRDFAELRKMTFVFVMSVCAPVCYACLSLFVIKITPDLQLICNSLGAAAEYE